MPVFVHMDMYFRPVKTALVTGGAGFIGSHVAEELLRSGYEVHILDDLSGGAEENIPKAAHFHSGNIASENMVNDLFDKFRFDFVFHLAAYAAENGSHFRRNFNYTNNLIGSANLINAAVNHTVQCFVYTSSIAVYGEVPPPVSEETKPQPMDPYGIAKYAVELDLKAAKEMFDLDYIIFRPHNVFGIRQNIFDADRNVVSIFMKQLLNNHAMTVFGDGSQTRAFSPIETVAPIIAKSIEVPEARNEIFNLGSDQHLSVKQLAEMVATVLKKEVTIKYLPERKEALHSYASHEKAKKVFSESIPKRPSLLKSLLKMAAWAKTKDLSITQASPKAEIK